MNDTIHTFSKSFSIGTIKEYEKHMLTTGKCRAFLPMAFVRESDINSDTNCDINSDTNSDINSDTNSDINSDTNCDTNCDINSRSDTERDRVIYNYGGYVPLADVGKISLLQGLEITEKVLCALLTAGEHLINPARIQLNLETVHIDATNGNVRIAYVPFQNTKVRIQDTIESFLRRIEGICSGENAAGYFESLRKFARLNMSVSDMIDKARLIRREIRLCGLN